MFSGKATKQHSGSFAVARGLALFIAGFCALNLLSYLLGNSANQNGWWIDMSVLPMPVSAALQLLMPVFLIWFVIVPRAPFWRCLVTATLCGIIALLAASNVVTFYTLFASGALKTGFAFPFSFLVCLLFVFLALRVVRARRMVQPRRTVTARHTVVAPEYPEYPDRPAPKASPLSRLRTTVAITATFIVVAVIFPLMQILCFGLTDYRQPVDTAIVLGAQVYPNGGLSPALEERVATGIELYKQGYTPTLIMSGGVDVDGTSEAHAMRDYAVRHGVPTDAILLDPYGASTDATAINTTQICKQQGFKTVSVVSTFYHLPRIKQVFLGTGLDVYTVPATVTYYDSYLVFSVAREIPGWWLYWLKGLVS